MPVLSLDVTAGTSVMATTPQAEQGDLQFDGHGKGGLSRLDREFLAFHQANPHVYRTLAALAREWLTRKKARADQTGMLHMGVGMLWERMRWEVSFQAHDRAEFKCNNSYRSRFARLLMEQEPDLAGVFEIRELRS